MSAPSTSEGLDDLAPDVLLRAALAEAWHVDRLYVRAARLWADVHAETGSAAAAVKVASAWASIGEDAAAYRWLETARAVGDDYAELLDYVQGLVRLGARDPDGAITALTRAAERDPGRARSLNALGALHKRFGRERQAVHTWREALRREPGHALALVNLASMPDADDPLGALRKAVVSGVHEAAPFAALHARYTADRSPAAVDAARKVRLRARWRGPIPPGEPADRTAVNRAHVRGVLGNGTCRLYVDFRLQEPRTPFRVLVNPGWTVVQDGTVLGAVDHGVRAPDQPTLAPVDAYHVDPGTPVELLGRPTGPATAIVPDRVELDGRSAWLPLPADPVAWHLDVTVPTGLVPRWSGLTGSPIGPGVLALPEPSWLGPAPTGGTGDILGDGTAAVRWWLRLGTATWTSLLGPVPPPAVGIVGHDDSTFCYTRENYVRVTSALLARPDQWSQLAHEAGHLWWGTRVGFAPDGEWLAEALAEYTLHRLQDGGVCRDYRAAALSRCLDRDATGVAARGLVDLAAAGGVEAATALRLKGGFMIASLARIMGTDAFRRLLAVVVGLGARKSLRAYDFFAVAGWVHGTRLTWFANQWLHTEATPEVRLSWRRTARRGARLDLVLESGHCFGVGFPVTLHGADGQAARYRVDLDSGQGALDVDVPFEVGAVTANDEHELWTRVEVQDGG